LSFKENLKFMHTHTHTTPSNTMDLSTNETNKKMIKLGGKFRLPFLPQFGGGGGWRVIHNRFGLKAGKKS